MKQKETIIDVLQKFGGRALVRDICALGKYYIGDSSAAQGVENNIRRILNSNPDTFRHPDGVEKGEWELVSYHDEMTRLRHLIETQNERIRELEAVPKAVDLENLLLLATTEMTKHDRHKADFVRLLFDKVGYKNAANALDDFIEEKENAYLEAIRGIGNRQINLTGNNIEYHENNYNDTKSWPEK